MTDKKQIIAVSRYEAAKAATPEQARKIAAAANTRAWAWQGGLTQAIRGEAGEAVDVADVATRVDKYMKVNPRPKLTKIEEDLILLLSISDSLRQHLQEVSTMSAADLETLDKKRRDDDRPIQIAAGEISDLMTGGYTFGQIEACIKVTPAEWKAALPQLKKELREMDVDLGPADSQDSGASGAGSAAAPPPHGDK
jgi:hypothetical protein